LGTVELKYSSNIIVGCTCSKVTGAFLLYILYEFKFLRGIYVVYEVVAINAWGACLADLTVVLFANEYHIYFLST